LHKQRIELETVAGPVKTSKNLMMLTINVDTEKVGSGNSVHENFF